MKKSILSIIAATMLAVPVMAEDKKEKIDPNAESVSGMFKLMHILSAEDNQFDRDSGSAFLLNVKYKSQASNNIRAVVNHYSVGDTGLTDFETTGKPARGMFVNGSTGRGETVSLLAELHALYKTKTTTAKVGRQIWNTPLSTIKWSMMPNFYEGATFENKSVEGLTINASHMTKMSYGSRALTDFALIGEGSATAGASKVAKTNQAEFLTFGQLTGVTGIDGDDSAGMTTVGIDYSGVKNLTVRAWNYLVHDLESKLYADAEYKMPLSKTTKLIIGAQYLDQDVDYSGITGQTLTSNYSLTGAKVALKGKGFGFSVAMNESSGDNAMLNIYGSDPAYTSMIFSRNAYRQNVSAYKVGASVGLMKGLKLKLAYANYGQSEGIASSNADAEETDIVLIYHPNKKKNMMFKIFNALRTSENDTTANDKTMNHVRAVAYYKF